MSHVSIDLNEQPPPFSTYNADFYTSDDGDIITHDHHLNQDGEALYRFLLEQSKSPPNYTVDINGTHKETRTRTVTRTVNGRRETRVETYTVTITDFSFSIDLTPYLVVGPVLYSYPDDAPVYRGLMVRQVMAGAQGTKKVKRKATKEEIQQFKATIHARQAQGLPPWKDLDGTIRLPKSASSMNLRQWADEYAASPKLLKEFVYYKTVYGWNTSKLKDAIHTLIRSTNYSGTVHTEFNLSATRICIRPDNRLSRALSSTLIKALLWVTLIYPFIWLFKRFNRAGGGRWEIFSGAFGLVHIVPIGEQDTDVQLITHSKSASDDQEESNTDLILASSSSLAITKRSVVEIPPGSDNLHDVTGYREGEWFREWENTIRNCVLNRVQESEPLTLGFRGPVQPAEELDGYNN
ncbi:hypothetical protein CVT24_000512 [Panaeolus cyanescens]|uniref:Uncharacterized protein n=1 Tax=Panaeolus cyanescens TaxID=181874 RepID=A0A409V8F6_9AGAR|nr:hypothetical protein CVT24_000512 [Panaeolus cyanescens]